MSLNPDGLITLQRQVELLPYQPRPFLNISAIYMIANIINDKYYIGSAKNVRLRTTFHKYQLRNNKHDNKHLQGAWNLYGESNFIFLILEKATFEKLEEKEQTWIDALNANNPDTGYNLRIKATSNQGHKLSEETKKKMGNSKRGKPRSNETKEKLRLANLGKTQSKETAQKRSNSMKGKLQTPEHRAKLSEAAKLRWQRYHANQ